jgi:hypothetical protein
MVEDHYPTVEEIVREFYVNIYRRWIRGKEIVVTPTLISTIKGAPLLHDPVYQWPMDHLRTRAEMVECFAARRPH